MKMCQGLTLICFLLLGGGAWGSTKFPQAPLASSEEPSIGSHDHSKEKIINAEDKTEKSLDRAVKHDKMLNDNRGRIFKDFDFGEMIESMLPSIMHEDDILKKKPKVKTVVSLTEVIGPNSKHHPFDSFMSPFGTKENSFIDDTFFDLPKILSFMPKFSKIDFVWPLKQNKEKEKKNIEGTNLMDVEFSPPFPWHHHHTSKKDMKNNESKPYEMKEEKSMGSNVFIKEPRIMSLNEVKVEEGTITESNADTLEKVKDKMNSLAKSLPYIEGAIGGVMFVMLILLVATWRIRRPGQTWATIPFVDESHYGEKI